MQNDILLLLDNDVRMILKCPSPKSVVLEFVIERKSE